MISGAILAAVLLVNSVVNYIWMTPRIVTGQIRREMNHVVQRLDRQIQQLTTADDANLTELVRNLRRSEEDLAWIEVRSRSRGVLARDGINAGPSFTPAEIHERLRNRESLAVTRKLASGDVVAEVFPFRLPAAGSPGTGFAEVEMAMWTDRAGSALWPLRRNLIINCTAACALLLAILTMRLRLRSYLIGRKLEDELRIAQEVQRALLPSTELAASSVTAASECVASSGIAGDIHDLFETPGGNVAVVCGDVSGKGIPAALLMGVIHGAVRSMDWYEAPRAHEIATQRLNRMLCDRASDARFATLFWGWYDPLAERLHYINAGHCPPLLARRWRETTEIRPLDGGGPVLGLLPNARYREEQVDLCPGDLVVLYSDGVIEAANAEGEEFGEERLRALISAHASCSPEEVRQAVLQAVRQFAGSREFADDLTLLAVRFTHDEAAAASDAVLDAQEVLVS
jgi:hypothetical protein